MDSKPWPSKIPVGHLNLLSLEERSGNWVHMACTLCTARINSVECMRVCVCVWGGGEGVGIKGKGGGLGRKETVAPFPFSLLYSPPPPSPLSCHDVDCERQYIKQNILIKFVSIHLQIWLVYTNRT